MAPVPPIDAVEQVTLPPIRPGVGWYVLGAAVIVLGLVGGFFLLTAGAFGYLGEIDDLQRTSLPGDESIVLSRGDVIVFHEPEGGLVGSPASLGLTLRDPAGRPVTLEDLEQPDRYAVQERQGVAIARFTVQTSGRYEVSSTGGTGSLAIGPSPGGRLTRFGTIALVTAAVALVAGVALVVGTRRRRRRAHAERVAMQQSHRPVERLA